MGKHRIESIELRNWKKTDDEGIEHASVLCKLGTSKIKNKSVKIALESDVADYIVKERQKK